MPTQIRGANNGVGTSQIRAGTISNADIHASAAIDLAKLSEAVIQADGGQAFTADQSMGGFKLTNLGTPSGSTDAVNKAYVDARDAGLDPKASVRMATTANLAATRAGNVLTHSAVGVVTIDGVAPVLGDRVLIKDQTTAADNGIYTVTTVGTASVAQVYTRAADADTDAEVNSGMYAFVEEGTTNADTGWILTTNNPITVNTTGLAFAKFTHVAITYAAPGSIEPDDAAAEGAASTVARSDHKHAIVAAAPGTISPDDTAAEGVATSFARSDHRHAITAAVASNLLVAAAAAEGSATTFARADHQHGTATPAAPTTITPDTVAAAGTGTAPARQDHAHGIDAAVAVNLLVAAAAAEGSSTSFARADHQHGTATPAAPTTIVPDAAAAAGSGTAPARQDHTHGIVADVAVAIAIGDVAAEGASTSFARANHVHGVSGGNPIASNPGDTMDAGAATTFARSNHRHSRESFIVRETPTGTVNGVNAVFDLANLAVTGSEMVFLNGILQEPGAVDYTRTDPTTTRLTFVSAPQTGDIIRVTYLKAAA